MPNLHIPVPPKAMTPRNLNSVWAVEQADYLWTRSVRERGGEMSSCSGSPEPAVSMNVASINRLETREMLGLLPLQALPSPRASFNTLGWRAPETHANM